MGRIFLVVIWLFYSLIVNAKSSDQPQVKPDSVAVKFALTINSQDLKNHLLVLSSNEYKGREATTEGENLSAAYIANKFSSLGFPPVQENSYYQKFPLSLKNNEKIILKVGKIKYKFLKDFYCMKGFNDFECLGSKIYFIGYGINDARYNDFRDTTNLRNKVLMFLDKEPYSVRRISHVTGSEQESDWSKNWNKKLEHIRVYNPKCILIVDMDLENNMIAKDDHIEKKMVRLLGIDEPDKYPPVLYVSKNLANTLLAENQTNIDKIIKSISRKGESEIFKLITTIDIAANNRQENIVYAKNVLGYIEGNEKKDELVIITAHYDHLGEKKDKIYYGADDNASGTSAVLELAEAFSLAVKEGFRPLRSILFMSVSAEEKGLLGSRFYVEYPVYPLQNTVANLNVDMIGRLDKEHPENPNYIYIIGSDKLSTELHEINEAANNTYTQLELNYTYNNTKDPNRFYYRSDHYNFAKNNIPIIFYFNGVHEDYHKHTDTADKIDFKKMEKISRLIFYTAWELANRENRIVVDKVFEEVK